MKMIEMDYLFVKEGFSVDHCYNSATNDYTYTIEQDGVKVSEKFKYEGETSQINFVNRLIHLWHNKFNTANLTFANFKGCCNPVTFYIPKINKVIFNDPATIVLWSDGTKTVVKCQDEDIFDPEKGLAMAISKKAMGNKGNYCDQIKKWTEKYEPPVISGKVAYTGSSILSGFKKAVASAINAAEKFAASTESCKLKEPDMDTKREMLNGYCNKRWCSDCPMNGTEFKCGRGLGFKKCFPSDEAIVSEEEVNKAFKLAFPEFEGGDK